jgi:VanZ family protein
MTSLGFRLLGSRSLWAFIAAALCVLIFIQSSREAVSIQDDPLGLVFGDVQDDRSVELTELAHKLAHLGLFGALAFSLHRATGQLSPTSAFLAATVAFLYGVSDEWHQSFVAARDASAVDLSLDLVGALYGSLASLTVSRPASHSLE